MERKTFFKRVFSLTASVAIGGWAEIGRYRPPSTITVLHSNDTLGQVESMPRHSQYRGMGGMSKRAALIEQLRTDTSPTILLDAGNVTGDTVYTDVHGAGLIYRMMSEMDYDATTLGERDLRQGIGNLAEALKSANFPVIVSNYDVQHENLNRFIQRYHVLSKGDLRIGVFGLGSDVKSCGVDHLDKVIDYRNPKLISEAMVRRLKYQEECDLIICLSRLGFKSSQEDNYSDLRLAREVDGINMIIGGPSRLFMDQGKVIKKPDGSSTIISHAGYGGIMLGRTKFEEREDRNYKILSSNQLVS